MMKRLRLIALSLAVLLSEFTYVAADEVDAKKPDSKTPRSGGLPSVEASTLGGRQFWSDQLLFRQWRIQSNVFTGHYRLLDENNVRRAVGTFERCKAKLEEMKRRYEISPMQGKAVIVLHGLARSRSAMKRLCRYLADNGQYAVFNVTYPSTRGGIGMHAEALASIVDNLDGIEEINFVAHSLGNLVIRHYLADQTDAQTCRRPDPRIKRIVMLGPPNNGTKLGQTFGRNRLFELLGGASARQLARGWQELDGKLATPQCQFGIIAGGRGDERGRNPILEGDDDFVVRVEETRLAGARDFLLLPVMHATMIHDRTVHGHALRFLRHGYFRSDAERQPIVEADQSQK